MTNNPLQVKDLEAHGIRISEVVAMDPQVVTNDNMAYLQTKVWLAAPPVTCVSLSGVCDMVVRW